MSTTREQVEQIPESDEVRSGKRGKAHIPTLGDPLIAACGERLLGIPAGLNTPHCEECERLTRHGRWGER